jgi:hypothetical protein
MASSNVTDLANAELGTNARDWPFNLAEVVMSCLPKFVAVFVHQPLDFTQFMPRETVIRS